MSNKGNLYMSDLNEHGYPILLNCRCGEQGTKTWLFQHRKGCKQEKGTYGKCKN